MMPISSPPCMCRCPETASPSRMMAIPATLFLLGKRRLQIMMRGTITMFMDAIALTAEAGRLSRASFSKIILPAMSSARTDP